MHIPEKFLVANIVVKMAPCQRRKKTKSVLPLQIFDTLLDNKSSPGLIFS
jgi:hypothetical protein